MLPFHPNLDLSVLPPVPAPTPVKVHDQLIMNSGSALASTRRLPVLVSLGHSLQLIALQRERVIERRLERAILALACASCRSVAIVVPWVWGGSGWGTSDRYRGDESAVHASHCSASITGTTHANYGSSQRVHGIAVHTKRARVTTASEMNLAGNTCVAPSG